MHQPVVLFIGLRYICGRSIDRFSRFVSLLATIGITLGVMALITVLSVMNGFEKNLENNILGFMPQALVTSIKGSINPKKLSAISIKNLSGVNNVTSLTSCKVVLQSTHSVAIGVMLGINPYEKDPLSPYLNGSCLQALQPNKYNVILGYQLALQLGVKNGEKLRIIAPSASYITIIGRMPSQRLFNVIGTFFANSEVDQYQLLINQQDASRLTLYPLGNITGWRIYMDKPLDIDRLVRQPLKQGLVWKDWREYKGELFQAVQMEKNIIGLLVSFIIDIAVFNIMISLSLLVMEKKNEIAILQTQGLTKSQIMSVFIIQGASTGIIGALLGSILGILCASQINLIPGLNKILIDSNLPVNIHISQVIIIIIITIILAILSTLYPSWRATKVNPVEALRYD
ncbi:Lipoprotein-releasing system transmembrane protein LolC [Candidatus Profftia lariciata]|uniref:lipoprotein-releasing ABC transporter permease subunit LolC n=1 Tax=Candidatus Profftia lariciata TaxID=1987921 RepID=UPI001D02CB01|nr:lipoprotein-releasing ABC transporter permease subunit LolC [Candidatus Profftia lariciata]UDG81722.1 Lipoprotein-releasing system transmembrane protein LolC [Candidatus Profftia lariciata]